MDITTVGGSVDARIGATNALRTLEVLKVKDVPVYAGHNKPLLRQLTTAEWVHGSDGLGDANIPWPSKKLMKGSAVNFIMDTVMKSNPNEITLVATGPPSETAHKKLH